MSGARRGRLGATAALIAGVAALLLTGCGTDSAPAGTTIQQSEVPGVCPPHDGDGAAAIDWVPFVKVDGVSYQSAMPEMTVDESALGDTVSTVRCRLDGVVGDPEYKSRDGDAAFLPAGTELREVLGYRTDFRLAAKDGATWTIYESYNRPNVETGEDMLDLRGKVAAIDLVEGYYGRDIEQTVSAPEAVAAIVDAILAAPVVPEDERDEAMGAEAPMFIRFDLLDGTSVQRAWHVEAGIFALEFRAPPALMDAFGNSI